MAHVTTWGHGRADPHGLGIGQLVSLLTSHLRGRAAPIPGVLDLHVRESWTYPSAVLKEIWPSLLLEWVVPVEAWTDQLSYHHVHFQGFEVANTNIYTTYDF